MINPWLDLKKVKEEFPVGIRIRYSGPDICIVMGHGIYPGGVAKSINLKKKQGKLLHLFLIIKFTL